MKMYFLIKNFKKQIYFIILIIILAVFTNAFYNFYSIMKRPYQERMGWNYGFDCEKYSYGFIYEIFQKKEDKDIISIINFENMPNIEYLFHDKKFDNNYKNLILLNFNTEDKEKLKNFKVDLNDYQLIEKSNNCYFYKK